MSSVCPDGGWDCDAVVGEVDEDVDVVPILDAVDLVVVISLWPRILRITLYDFNQHEGRGNHENKTVRPFGTVQKHSHKWLAFNDNCLAGLVLFTSCHIMACDDLAVPQLSLVTQPRCSRRGLTEF